MKQKINPYKTYPIQFRFRKFASMDSYYYVEYRIIKDPNVNPTEALRRLLWNPIKRWFYGKKVLYSSWQNLSYYHERDTSNLHPKQFITAWVCHYYEINDIKASYKTLQDIIDFVNEKEQLYNKAVKQYNAKNPHTPNIIY